MNYIRVESPEYLRKCKEVGKTAHERTTAYSQRHGANLQVGSEEWQELYGKQWQDAYAEAFEGIAIVHP